MPAHNSLTTYMCNVFVVLLHHIILPQGAASGTKNGEAFKHQFTQIILLPSKYNGTEFVLLNGDKIVSLMFSQI